MNDKKKLDEQVNKEIEMMEDFVISSLGLMGRRG